MAASDHGTYEAIALMARDLHRSLADWCQERLRDAGLEHIRVLGHFQPKGSSLPSVVIFPYRITPFPRLLDNTVGVSLMGNWKAELVGAQHRDMNRDPRNMTRKPGATRMEMPSQLIPRAWVAFGQAFRRRLEVMLDEYGEVAYSGQPRRDRAGRPVPATLVLDRLPKNLQDWYRKQVDDPPQTWERIGLLAPREKAGYEPWVIEIDGIERARLPFITWVPGFDVALYYLVVGQGEPRRDGEWQPVDPPLSLPALAVITAAVQLEREIQVDRQPLLIPPRLLPLVDAIDDIAPRNRDERSLTDLLDDAMRPPPADVALRPVHDLSNQEFSLLMQALQRPLEPAVNLALHMRMGLGPRLVPGALVVPRAGQIQRPKPKRFYRNEDTEEGSDKADG